MKVSDKWLFDVISFLRSFSLEDKVTTIAEIDYHKDNANELWYELRNLQVPAPEVSDE